MRCAAHLRNRRQLRPWAGPSEDTGAERRQHLHCRAKPTKAGRDACGVGGVSSPPTGMLVEVTEHEMKYADSAHLPLTKFQRLLACPCPCVRGRKRSGARVQALRRGSARRYLHMCRKLKAQVLRGDDGG